MRQYRAEQTLLDHCGDTVRLRGLTDINIAATTTALQTLAPDGHEQGLRFGANVIMPQATPLRVRHHYTLYDRKPCLDDSAGQCAACLDGRIRSVGRRVLRNSLGDSKQG